MKSTDNVSGGDYLKKYFTQFPNIIDDSELDPFEFRLLLHFYRVGQCTQGVRTTANICKMSTGKVAQVRKRLEEKGFIKITPFGDSVNINVIDKYIENGQKYRSSGEQGVHAVDTSVHAVDDRCSPHEHKKNPSKKNPLRIDLPFQSDAFLEKWNDWQTHRKEKKSPLTTSAIKMQLKYLAKFSEADAIRMISQSIFNGWSGIWKIKEDRQQKKNEEQNPTVYVSPIKDPNHFDQYDHR